MIKNCKISTALNKLKLRYNDFMLKRELEELYLEKQLSMSDIAHIHNVSVHKVSYWLKKHNITARTRSDANYIKSNPNGDPFSIIEIKTLDEARLFGEGIGLYWGEGTKSDTYNVRLGNTDAHLIKRFLEFLIVIYRIDQQKLRFSIQTFNDTDIAEVEKYWQQVLGYPKTQFNKTIVTKSNTIGNYKRKSKYGVLTVYFSNVKLRNILVDSIPKGGVKYMSG